METNQIINVTEKTNFLQNELIKHLENLNGNENGAWGVLNAQQMVEHLSDAFRNYNGFDSKKVLTPAEHLSKFKEFLISEKPFKQNTKNIEMPEVPLPPKHPDMKAALEELKTEINNFFIFFEKNPERTITNVFFGNLNFEESVHLLHKHAIHHLRQFSLVA